jgi:hypothetical protein
MHAVSYLVGLHNANGASMERDLPAVPKPQPEQRDVSRPSQSSTPKKASPRTHIPSPPNLPSGEPLGGINHLHKTVPVTTGKGRRLRARSYVRGVQGTGFKLGTLPPAPDSSIGPPTWSSITSYICGLLCNRYVLSRNGAHLFNSALLTHSQPASDSHPAFGGWPTT